MYPSLETQPDIWGTLGLGQADSFNAVTQTLAFDVE